jgi:ricin-type beta-trefoil lectin protein
MGDQVLRKRLVQAVVAFVVFSAGLVFGPTPAHAVGEAYGPYYLVNYYTAFGANPQCLADPGASTANNVQQILYACGYGGQLSHNVAAVTNSDYWIANSPNGKCLVPYGGSTSSGAWIVQYDCNAALSVRWRYIEMEPNFPEPCPHFPHTGMTYCTYHVFKIQNLSSNLCIASKDGVVSQLTGLVQYPCDAVASNLWVQIKA